MHINFLYLLIIICSFWVISEVLLAILRRSKDGSRDFDKGSIKWLNAIIYISITIAVSFGFSGIGKIRVGISVIPWVGLFFITAGLLIRWAAILTLRKYFTTNVAIHSGQKIIRTGLYRCVRHPSYTGSIMSFCGMGLALSNYISFVILVIPITIAFLMRIRIEEQAMVSAFGEEYENYRKKTWYLFPWIY